MINDIKPQTTNFEKKLKNNLRNLFILSFINFLYLTSFLIFALFLIDFNYSNEVHKSTIIGVLTPVLFAIFYIFLVDLFRRNKTMITTILIVLFPLLLIALRIYEHGRIFTFLALIHFSMLIASILIAINIYKSRINNS